MEIKGVVVALGLCASLPAMVQAGQTVTIGVWGFVNVQVPPQGGVNLVGCNFTSTTTNYLKDVFQSGTLIQNADPALADTVYLWNESLQGYDKFFQKSDGLFYSVSSPGGAAVQVPVETGDALFIKSPVGEANPHSVLLSGMVSLDAQLSKSYSGKTVLANVYPTDMNLSDASHDWSGATSGELPTTADQVHVWDPDKTGGAGYQNYFLKDVNGQKVWHSGVSPFPQADPVIPPGGGAFYTAVGSFSQDIVRPFDI